MKTKICASLPELMLFWSVHVFQPCALTKLYSNSNIKEQHNHRQQDVLDQGIFLYLFDRRISWCLVPSGLDLLPALRGPNTLRCIVLSVSIWSWVSIQVVGIGWRRRQGFYLPFKTFKSGFKDVMFTLYIYIYILTTSLHLPLSSSVILFSASLYLFSASGAAS